MVESGIEEWSCLPRNVNMPLKTSPVLYGGKPLARTTPNTYQREEVITYPNPKKAEPMMGTIQWTDGYVVQANKKSPTVTHTLPGMAWIR